MTRAGSSPLVSVVVGARSGEADVTPLLQALEPQLDDDVEVVLVTDARWPPAGVPDGVRVLHRPGALVPELWAAGLREVRGTVVALTAGTLRPAPDWVDRARAFALTAPPGVAAAGGAFDGSVTDGAVDRAVLYCRYSPFLAPLPSGVVHDVPGDNALYRMDVLRRYEPAWRDGFWEPFVHVHLRRDGFLLTADGSLLVQQVSGLRLRGVLRQRYRHGRVHGRRRSTGSPARVRAAAATAPLVPLLMTARALRAAWRRPDHRRSSASSTPLLLLLYSAWAAGELRGRLDVAGGR